MELRPIKQTIEENDEFVQHPDCHESTFMVIEFYKKVGFKSPWIGYFAQEQGRLVGSAGFKGAPKDGKVEIAYGTFPQFQQQGIGTEICRQLVLLALATDPSVRILARTLPEENYSVKILRKNGFALLGTVWDEEDGDVWEWEFREFRVV
jgi:RimJ/RimL family protein N-acetyltransferase